MPERATVFQVAQLGVESTPGTAVPANRKLNSLMIEPSAHADVQTFKPSGNKYATVTALGREWSAGRVSGPGTFTELIYPLAGMYGYSAVTQIGTTGAYTWQFNPVSVGADTYKTFTVEKGSSDGSGAESSSYNVFTGWGYHLDRGTFDFTGDMIGRSLSSGITMTAAPTALAVIPILGKQGIIYMEATAGALTAPTTKLARLLSADFEHSGAKAPVWVVDSTQASYVAVVEQQPTTTLQIRVAADTQGMSMLADMRAGTMRYFQVKAVGANIGVSADYTFQHQLAGQVADVQEFGDADGLYAIGFTFQLIHDDAWGGGAGKAHDIKIVNKLLAL